MRRVFALFREGGVEARNDRLAVCSFITWRRITTTDDLTERDIRAIGATLEYWLASGEIKHRCRRIAAALAPETPEVSV
ncbi:hypothetical protein [Mycolicibacterium mageritense]|uniref:hypothetical protein n=1 Tax=Mycolicibacterium mageritense TaxID=53462 RepID=UPI001E4B70F1|nr:hypothetical protein [Mycolicibacterium mageritense]MCC9182590.1 hypothetical protein [Mycolicibacterium mageritense]